MPLWFDHSGGDRKAPRYGGSGRTAVINSAAAAPALFQDVKLFNVDGGSIELLNAIQDVYLSKRSLWPNIDPVHLICVCPRHAVPYIIHGQLRGTAPSSGVNSVSSLATC